MSTEEIYSRFIEWLDRAWWRLPASEHLLPSIQGFFTPEEAALLLGVPFMPTGLKELARLKGVKPEDLAAQLDDLAGKGAVGRMQRGDDVFYSLNDAFFIFFRGPFYPVQPDPSARALAPSLNRYVHDGLMDQLDAVHTKPLRTIPIHKTVEDPRRIMPYENVTGIVDSQEFLAVTQCACRQRKRLDPGSTACQHPSEVCLHFGKPAHYLVDNGLARRISREEAQDILKLAADAGLVHAVSNRQEGADTICNCCRCSCLFFESYHVLKHRRSHDFSNFRVRINPETCKACGLCVQRCPVQAIRLDDSPLAVNEQGTVATLVNPGHCLGCGVCVHKCPTQSLILESRPEILPPPKNVQEWMNRWVLDQKQAGAAGVQGG